MITLNFETTQIVCTEANAPKYRAIIDSGKFPKIKQSVDRKHDATRRDYPVFTPGMTTAEYVSLYQSANNRLSLHPLSFTFADRAAPMLDPTQPEVLEEIDPDWVQPVTQDKPKVKKANAAQLRRACQEALDWLAQDNKLLAELVLREVLEC